MNWKQIGENLLLLRISKKWTLEEAAKSNGVNAKSLGLYEKGRKIPLETLHKLCYDYDVSLDDMCNKKISIIVKFD